MACELPAAHGVPLSRWSAGELAREAVTQGIVERISGVTVWRWLSQDAIPIGKGLSGDASTLARWRFLVFGFLAITRRARISRAWVSRT